jgi:predicted DNA-binding transcriptional regulator AlpA
MKSVESKLASTVKEFCEDHGISLSTYYELKKQGHGPREMKIGRSGVRISREASADWRRERETAADAADKAGEAA